MTIPNRAAFVTFSTRASGVWSLGHRRTCRFSLSLSLRSLARAEALSGAVFGSGHTLAHPGRGAGALELAERDAPDSDSVVVRKGGTIGTADKGCVAQY